MFEFEKAVHNLKRDCFIFFEKRVFVPILEELNTILMPKKLLLLIFVGLTQICACQLIFAELQGNPVNITGWNLTGAANVNDTGGDPDTNQDEIILTNNVNSSSGGIFFTEPLDLATCNQWHVDFEFRAWEGNGADGLAFCFLDVPPSGFVSGGGVGIPNTANGIKVVFDTYNNWGLANPCLQIYSGNGYNENPALAPGIVYLDNIGGSLSFIRSNDYNAATITYNNGNISLTVNGTLYLTAFFPVSFAGYMGFTASTGGLKDKHSIKNVSIYADLAESNAGSDVTVCSGEPIQIGAPNNPNHTYSWNNTTTLNNPTISNPTATIVNNTAGPIVQQYIVETLIAANSGACPDYDTINVTVLPIETSIENAVICEDQLPYFWNGIAYNTSTNDTLTLLSTNSCDSSAILNLSINLPSSSSTDSILCDTQVPFEWNGLNIDSSGSYNATLTNSLGCDSSATIVVTIHPSLSSTTDSTVCDTELPLNWNGLTFNSSDIQSVTLSSIITGCDSIATLNLTVLPTSTSITDTVVCDTELPFNWNGLNFSASGQQIAILQSTLTGCDSLATLNVTVNPTLYSNTNIVICDHELPFEWNGLSLNNSGTSTVTLQSMVTGCDSLATLNLMVNPTLLSNTDTTVCSSELPFDWNGLTISAPGPQTANLESLLTGCDSLATLNCIVVNNPQIEIIVSSTTGCAPIEIEFSNAFTNENTSCAWIISNGNTFNNCNSTLTFTEAGCYDVSLTSTEQNCVSSLTQNNLICLESKPEASFTAAPAVINLSSQWVQFYNTSSSFVTNFLWNFGDEDFSIEENPQHLYQNNSFGYMANLIVSTDQGCADTASLFIECKEEPVIFIPNSFTPDEDQHNQQFNPILSPSIDPHNYTLLIFNRWGDIVFESHDPNIGWDGSYGMNGTDAPQGAYIWKITFKVPDTDEKNTISGHVNLLR